MRLRSRPRSSVRTALASTIGTIGARSGEGYEDSTAVRRGRPCVPSVHLIQSVWSMGDDDRRLQLSSAPSHPANRPLTSSTRPVVRSCPRARVCGLPRSARSWETGVTPGEQSWDQVGWGSSLMLNGNRLAGKGQGLDHPRLSSPSMASGRSERVFPERREHGAGFERRQESRRIVA